LVDFVIDFSSQLLKKHANLIFESDIAVRLGCDLLDLLQERRIVRQRPVPENSVLVTSLDLLDLQKMLCVERLLKEACDTLEGRLCGVCGVRGQEYALFVRVYFAESLLVILLWLVLIYLRRHFRISLNLQLLIFFFLNFHFAKQINFQVFS
jgi:hypothetical protein